MTYTDADVERVAEALCTAEYDHEYWLSLQDGAANAPDAFAYQREINRYLVMARAALESMEREPLENVMRDTATWLQHLEVALQDDGRFACTVYGYEVTGTDSPVMDATRYGADPAEAIHNAIAAAQEER